MKTPEEMAKHIRTYAPDGCDEDKLTEFALKTFPTEPVANIVAALGIIKRETVAWMRSPAFSNSARIPQTDRAFDAPAVHNDQVGKIVTGIVKPVLSAGGSTTDVMILTESVLVGVALACIKFGGDEKVLDLMFGRAKERLAEIRLSEIKTEGCA
jgi:hypothetical protein